MKSKLILIFLIVAVILFSLYQNASAATSTVNVGQGGLNFVPSVVTITRGDSVNWVWVGNNHSTTSGSCPGGICTSNGNWDSGVHGIGFTFAVTFNTSGTFPYFCSIHRSAMQGTVIVLDPAPSEVPEADSLVLILSGGVGLGSYLAIKWRARKRA